MGLSPHVVWPFIEEKNPLKQGLKLEFCIQTEKIKCIEEKNPLKQGLKQYSGD